MDETVRPPDDKYFDTLLGESNTNRINDNNMSEEDQLAFALMNSEEEYENAMILTQIVEIEENTVRVKEQMDTEKKRREIFCNPALQKLYYSTIPREIQDIIKTEIRKYKELEIEKIVFEPIVYTEFKKYLQVMEHSFGKFGRTVYSDLCSITFCS